MCRLYGVTRAGFYAWRSRERSERERQNEELTAAIRVAHAESRGTYGSPRVHQALRRRGHQVGKNRVARLMRRHGIKARVATIRYTSPSTQRFFDALRNEQLDLEITRPDQVWVGDITYLKWATSTAIWPSSWISTAGAWWAGATGRERMWR